MKPKKTLFLLSCIMLVTWISVIISFSSDNANISNEKSKAVLQSIAPTVSKIEDGLKIDMTPGRSLHFYVRKYAHMFNYLVLSVLIILVLKSLGLGRQRLYVMSWLSATLLSAADEYYQTFIPGRSGQVTDVLIDNIGVLIGLAVFYAIARIKEYERQ